MIILRILLLIELNSSLLFVCLFSVLFICLAQLTEKFRKLFKKVWNDFYENRYAPFRFVSEEIQQMV